MTTTVTFRAQEDADTGFLRRLFAAVLEPVLGLQAWPERERELLLRMQYDARERDWRERYPPGLLEIIEAGGAPAGRIRLSRPLADGSRRVVDLAIAPEYRCRGLATAALTRCEGALSLTVARTNLSAQRLYARLGFTVQGGDDLDFFLYRPGTGRSCAAGLDAAQDDVLVPASRKVTPSAGEASSAAPLAAR
ncbi:GNAT family N-acetyltransferase [Streptomyces sp. BPTC-684]|uniref:GNAT family N-acetyltransferase n=1 Tax=Streptomyces sp. BPTC-684 TaxID=3043734 RepID=UPI0024B184D1|nr:GNAT family N-acetyltransferase [Streptomyces sp. BPTC-684]WHM40900.1 GNAT family N-acetyltransferase [Streptomyces sp. BPTC-684]